MNITEKEKEAFIDLLQKSYDEMIKETHSDDLSERQKRYEQAFMKIQEGDTTLIEDTIQDIRASFDW